MNKFSHSLVRLVVWAFIVLNACTYPSPKINYTQFVDPLIGSDGHGHVFVGANVPFGAVQIGPNNFDNGWDWCSGYHYSDSIVIGFAQTHLNGTGCHDLGDVIIMPTTGPVHIDKGSREDISNGFASKYSHENEVVKPSYYSLLLDRYNINVELTASERVGMHRYTFPDDESEKHVVIDLQSGGDGGGSAYDTYIKQTDEYSIEGYRFSHGWASDQQVFFSMKSNLPFHLAVYDSIDFKEGSELRCSAVKGLLSFDQNPTELLLKVGISPVSCKNALANIEAEIPEWNFEKVVEQGQEKWNKELSKIEINTTDITTLRVFYTAMFHSVMAPYLFNDHNGDFRGHDKKVYTGENFTNYTTFSLWDTYRGASQLLTLTQPERIDDFVHTMIGICKQQGKLPVWPLWGCETNCMPGYSAVPVIADYYFKGLTSVDPEEILQAMKTSAEYPSQLGIKYILADGFISCDSILGGLSCALEYAVDDWSIAQLAKKLGKEEDFDYFFKRANYYKQYFDPELKLVRPKVNENTWRTPYDPICSTWDFAEGSGWQYSFLVPQDPNGLIELMGGDDVFAKKLDSLFTVEGKCGKNAPSEEVGLIGQYAHINEPSHPDAYLYPYAGQQWKTAGIVRQVVRDFYTDKPDGLVGNEDCGQMSAWYILSTMGFYPVSPSGGIYVFGSPLFEKTVLNLPEGKTFTVETENNSDENIYIQSVTLNGKPYTKSYIKHEDIVAGGVLKFVMGSQPNFNFAAASEDRPKTIL